MNELSKDNFVLALRGGVNIYISDEEKSLIESLINSGQKLIKVKGKLIMSEAILYIVSAADVEEAMMIKRGYVKCEKGHWYQRNLAKCDKCYY